MSKTIFLEVRDSMTFIPVMVTSLISNQEDQNYLLGRAGYEGGYVSVFVVKLSEGIGYNDAFKWPRSGRTMFEAHQYIRDNFHELKDGDVVDIEYILKETTVKKKSERF